MKQNNARLSKDFIRRVIKKVTDKETPLNCNFFLYRKEIEILSGTVDFCGVRVSTCGHFPVTLIGFSADFRTKEIILENGFQKYDKVLLSAFDEIYGEGVWRVINDELPF